MRFLFVHNFYQQHGGEDDVFASERDLLRADGHEVFEYTRHNDEIRDYSPLQKIRLAARTTWAGDTYADLTDLLRRHKPDVAHFHNTFPLISPAAYYACHRAGVPVVQTLHNARLLCANSNYSRAGKICCDCLGKRLPWPGVLHGCYHNSWVQTAPVSAMLVLHNLRATFYRQVNAYIVGSNFYRDLFVAAGYPPKRMHVKPHFVDSDPGLARQNGSYALFIGRLAPEKGADVLARAWETLRDIPLKVRGEGPLRPLLEGCARRNSQVELLPRLNDKEYLDLMRGARLLVWPSVGYYETFGRVAIEAFAAGVPVIASNVGANAELVQDGITGLHFAAADAIDLARQVRWAWQNPAEMHAMGRRARAQYEREFTPGHNYELLMGIYENVLGAHATAPVASQEESPVAQGAR